MEKVNRPDTLTVEETARRLGVSRSSAYEGVARGEIPSLRVGKRIIVPVAALERLLSGAATAARSATEQ